MAAFRQHVPRDIEQMFDEAMEALPHDKQFMDAILNQRLGDVRSLLSSGYVAPLLNKCFIVHVFGSNKWYALFSDQHVRVSNKFLVFNPLTAACYTGNLNIVKELVAAGADVNMTVKKAEEVFNQSNRTQLDLEDMEDYLEEYDAETYEGEPSDEFLRYGMTPLNIASLEGHAAVVEYLLTIPSVDPTRESAAGWQPFYTACRGESAYAHIDVLSVFLDSPIDVGYIYIFFEGITGWTPLGQLAANNEEEAIKLLLTSKRFARHKPSHEEIEDCHYHSQDDAGLRERWLLFKLWSMDPDDARIFGNSDEFYEEYKKRFKAYKAEFIQNRTSMTDHQQGRILHLSETMRQHMTESGAAAGSGAAAKKQKNDGLSQFSKLPAEVLRHVSHLSENSFVESFHLFRFCVNKEEYADDTLAANSPG